MSATSGEVPQEPAAFASLCGQDKPLRVIELSTEDVISRQPMQIGDRVLFTTPIYQDPWRRRLGSFRLCGDGVLLSQSMRSGPMIAPRWPGTVLVHTGYGNVVALDPEGVAPAVVVAADLHGGPFLSFVASDAGLVGFDWSDGDSFTYVDYFNRMTFYPYADAGTPALEPPVEFASGGGYGERVLGDELFFFPVNEEGEATALLRVSLPDLAETVVTSPAVSYAVTPTHLLLLSGSEAYLRDRETGEEFVFEAYSYRVHSFDSETLVLFHDEGGDADSTLIIDLVSGVRRRFAIARPEGRAPDGRWVLSNRTEVGLGDPLSGDYEVLSENLDQHTRILVGEDGVALIDGDEGELRLVSYTVDDEELLARRTSYDVQRLGDGRVVTRVDVDPEGGGDLVVVDRGTLAERLVDTHVVGLWTEGAEVLPPNVVAYQVRDGERSGLYLANLGSESVP